MKKTALWSSYILQGLVTIMFLFGAFNNLLQTEMAINGAIEMGYLKESVFYLGIFLFLATVLYLIPKTCILGAALLTAWLGGAVATHTIHHEPVTHIIPAITFGILVWLAIWLRNEKLRSLMPLDINPK